MPIGPLLFWSSTALLAYTYLGYPLVVAGLARTRPRPWRREKIEPSVSLVIAAWNEAGVIGDKLENALSVAYPRAKLQILVASDGSDDETVAIAKRFESRGVVVLDLPRGGKTAALNRAMERVTGEIVVFSDANVFFEPDALEKLVRHFADPKIGGASGDVRLRPDGFSLGASQGFYYRYERFLQEKESATGSIVGADGGMYAIRKRYFRTIPEKMINDDFIISMETVKQGGRLIYDPEAVAYEDSPVDAANELGRKTRVEQGNFQSLFYGHGVPGVATPGALAAYVSHKVLRWTAFAPLAVAWGSSFALGPAGALYRLAFGGQCLFYGLALAGWRLEGRGGAWLTVPFYFALENLAAVRGLYRALTGSTHWGTARTRTRQGA